MLGKPRIRLNNLKISLRFPCLRFNLIIDSINLNVVTEKIEQIDFLDFCVRVLSFSLFFLSFELLTFQRLQHKTRPCKTFALIYMTIYLDSFSF